MKERPILFNGDMVKAILDGRKTQTRRIVKDVKNTLGRFLDGQILYDKKKCPYGSPGDLLYVRENIYNGLQACNFYYKADDKGVGNHRYKQLCEYGWALKKTIPSIHMPKFATRIWLKVKSVRVERVQEISEIDAMREGDPRQGLIASENTHIDWFMHLWDSINKEQGWDENPWVWVIEFERMEK